MILLLVFGTRPEAIKMVPIYHEMINRKIKVKVCVTAQHRGLLDTVLNFFDIIPDYDLDLMTINQSLNVLSSKILKGLDVIFSKEDFDCIFVHGDTTTSSLAALAAFYCNIKVAHVEAGLRTYDPQNPFPEEVNRQITARISSFHFTPTSIAYDNLISEKVFGSIFNVGNTIVDSVIWAKKKLDRGYQDSELLSIKNILKTKKNTILCTIHRRENFGKSIDNICLAINEISREENIQIIFPVHPNPNVRHKVISKLNKSENIHLLDPLRYSSMIFLMSKCDLIFCDSGSIQEEAPTFKKPVIVLRDMTERMESIELGMSYLVGTDKDMICHKVNEILNNPIDSIKWTNPYGDGKSSERISDIIMKCL